MLEDASNSIAILVNPMSGEEFNVRRYSTSIGRDLGNDVVVASDRTMSRQHALVQFINGKFYVQDLQSKNGTRLNGGAVTNMMKVLNSGDELSVGLTRLIFLLIPAADIASWDSGAMTETVDPVVPRALAAR
ncbi:MAG: FHA domain-containing protein [Candidatus Obscuribacterales bacterium]|jgi:pSer/pThr/pTyr-binding forkhead associated (FHA) protein|nr:FHA domain-containing protein [Candidatus Obscuribacterales bacterium]